MKEIVVEMSGGHKLKLTVNKFSEMCRIIEEQARKETVKEILYKLKETLIVNNEENTEFFDYNFTLETIDELAKQYGVEE